jgi:hypothetical protein
MPTDVENLYADLVQRAARYGITVGQADLDAEVPGQFDGPTVTLNKVYDAGERAFYLAHSIGSIAEWSIHPDRSHQVFRELQQAKHTARSDATRLERALAAYLAFENATWEFAAWLLEDMGHNHFTPAFTNFGRADMEAMRVFHTTGAAPVWREFFATWNEQIRQGARTITPFVPRPIPEFQAMKIPKQEIVQEDAEEE